MDARLINSFHKKINQRQWKNNKSIQYKCEENYVT
ncbi:unnamed protein product [Paramecium pentaurelia]|uniref:Uncharacterized protein n=1 Tax=Paramecium pentaurelia TaxID=43138 RepID=A0A8S1SAK5_9CILI|nr:unnamed protein product [Paramecium pentaurelia]